MSRALRGLVILYALCRATAANVLLLLFVEMSGDRPKERGPVVMDESRLLAGFDDDGDGDGGDGV